ncbi:peptidoglycan-binding protein [Candidatus Parcubacteria bacterium]|nr:peptidoglycan-binding protein [Candidatus Parcubacteria bacterium]
MLIPLASFAETSSTSISALLEQIKALQAQIVSLQTQQSTAVASLVDTLKQGSSGDQVAVLQALLAADPDIYPEGLITGFFGPKTAAAVSRFQKKNGLESVGNVGPKTLAKLNNLLRESPVALENGTSTNGQGKRPCAIVPPGHLIAPGWLKKNGGVRPIVPACQTLPPGIAGLLNGSTTKGTTTPPVATTTPDTTAPVISAVSTSGVSSTSAMVLWVTNEAATSKIYFGTTTPFDMASSTNSTMTNSSLTTSHSFTLSNLTASTTYSFVLESKDAANNTATTSTQSFVTTN